MLMVGLTGGIGAGKSAVSRRLAELGAVIIDSDVLAREVVARGTDGLAEVVAAFGDGVLGPDGELDRPALGQKVFGDDQARRTLEAIIHPRVRARAAEIARTSPADAVVVNDVPLLVETGLAPTYHLVAIVMASAATRVRRLAETRGMSAEQAHARIAAQATDEQRRAVADVLLDNEDDLQTLHTRVDHLWRERLVPYEKNVRLKQGASRAAELTIVPYDPEWPARADRLIGRIRHAIAPTVSGSAGSEEAAPGAVGVSHIGSTAVPGLAAKDVIDLMVAVPSLKVADELAAALGRAGFPGAPGEWFDNARNLPGQTWPKRFHRNADPGCAVNLHVRVAGSPGWRFALLMRDHLRADGAARDAYAEAKQQWQARHDLTEVYAEAKEPWFDTEAAAAEKWAESTGWHP